MSQEEKKDTPPSDNEGTKKTETPPADTAGTSTTSATSPDPAKTDASAPQKRGIGFLGRRGTAPIRSAAKPEDKKDEKKDEAKDSPPPKPTPIGFAEKLFINISEIPFLALLCLTLLWALHHFASVWLPSVYFKEELFLVETYFDMQGLGQWFIPPATEHMEFIFPVFFWFMALVDAIPMTESMFLPLVAALSSLIALMGTYYLAKSLGLGKKISFAAGLISLASLSLAQMGHFISLDLFSMGLFAFALGFLFRAWTSDSAPMYFIMGFLFTALATLSIGYFPLWTILISSLLFIVWRATFGRAHKLDAVMGFGMLVLVFATWLMIIIIGGGEQADALNGLMQHMIAPFTPPFWPLKAQWYYVFICLSLGLAPWILLPLFVSWLKVFKNTLPSLKASRKESSGPAWLYITLLVGIALIILGGGKYATLLITPILIVLLAKALCNLTALGSKVFYAVFSLLIFISTILCLAIYFAPTSTLWADYLPEVIAKAIPYLKGLEVISGILLVYALVLVKFTKRASPVGPLLVVSMFTLLLVQASTMLLAPSLVDNTANYHPLGVGKDTLPFGIGAPAIVLSLDKESQPTTATPVTAEPVPSKPAQAEPVIPEPAPSASTPDPAPVEQEAVMPEPTPEPDPETTLDAPQAPTNPEVPEEVLQHIAPEQKTQPENPETTETVTF